MRILFIHQNCPAQFKYLAPRLAADRQNEVWYITKEGKPNLPGVTKAEYKIARQATEKIHPYVKPFEEQVLYGQAAARAAVSAKAKGFTPDVIFCHPGWGEGLFIIPMNATHCRAVTTSTDSWVTAANQTSKPTRNDRFGTKAHAAARPVASSPPRKLPNSGLPKTPGLWNASVTFTFDQSAPISSANSMGMAV